MKTLTSPRKAALDALLDEGGSVAGSSFDGTATGWRTALVNLTALAFDITSDDVVTHGRHRSPEYNLICTAVQDLVELELVEVTYGPNGRDTVLIEVT